MQLQQCAGVLNLKQFYNFFDMKKYFIVLLLALCLTASAQPGKKPPAKKDITKMIKEKSQKAGLDDAEAEKMFDKMMNRMGQNPAEVKKQMAALPPPLDNSKIPGPSKKMPKVTPATEAALLADLKSMLVKAETGLDSRLRNGLASYQGNARQTGYAGVTLWMDKQPDAAIYLMLKACTLDPADFVLLNNFSACLSMSGLPHKAIPFLNYIEKNIPGNTTVLNNLGQAWLGLGNISNAKSFLEMAVKNDSTHAEANYSLAMIANGKGNTAQCAGFLDRSIEGSVSPAVHGQWSRSHSSSGHVYDIIRNRFKQLYKETPITKRWRLLSIPSSIKQAREQEASIMQFFDDVEETLHDISPRVSAMLENAQKKEADYYTQQRRGLMNYKNIDELKQVVNKHMQRWHPLKFQAVIVFNSWIDDSYASSYHKRLEKAEATRQEQIKGLNNSLESLSKEIDNISKQIASLDIGEGKKDNEEFLRLDKQKCNLKKQLQQQEIAGTAEINNQYIANAEDLLNQKLQEELFWTALYYLPENPYPYLYKCYQQYLEAIERMKGLYPYPLSAEITCSNESNNNESTQITGELQHWEDSHCPVNINWDVKVASMTFNCKEVTIKGKFEAFELDWTRKVDRITWETTEHAISITAGKEFEKKGPGGIKGSVGGEGKLTVKLDGNYTPVDLIVKGSAGVEVSAPGGIKAGADLGSVEISVSSGMRGEGPVPAAIGKMIGN